MEMNKCVVCGKEYAAGNAEWCRYVCSAKCEQQVQWAYVVLRCDGRVDVVPCERKANLETLAQEAIGCEKIDVDDVESFFTLDEPFVNWGEFVFLSNANDQWDYAANFKEKANRAVWGFVQRVVYGDVVLIQDGGNGRGDILSHCLGFCKPMPRQVADLVVGVVRQRVGVADDDAWIPKTYPLAGKDVCSALKVVKVRKTCVTCGKAFEICHYDAGRTFFCSDACEEKCVQWGYVVVRCDGTIEAVECARTDSIGAEVWPMDKVCRYDYRYNCLHDQVDGPDEFFHAGVMFKTSNQLCFDATALDARVNRAVWALDGTLVLDDVIVAGCYDHHGRKKWMPLSVAKNLAASLRKTMEEVRPRPIPSDRLKELLVKNENPPFFERCCRRGLFGSWLSVFLHFTDTKDADLYESAIQEWNDGARECSPIVETEDGFFAETSIRGDRLAGDFPINEYRESLAGRKFNAAVMSGRIKIYVGFRFDDPTEFVRFRQEESALEGRDWKVLFEGKARSEDDETVLFDSNPKSCVGMVLVGTSLKVPWLDLTPCKTIELSGDFKK